MIVFDDKFNPEDEAKKEAEEEDDQNEDNKDGHKFDAIHMKNVNKWNLYEAKSRLAGKYKHVNEHLNDHTGHIWDLIRFLLKKEEAEKEYSKDNWANIEAMKGLLVSNL